MNLLTINPEKESAKIVQFLKRIFSKTGFSKAIVGISGGTDSTTSLFLLARSIPAENIIPVHLYYFKPDIKNINKMLKTANIPGKKLYSLSIRNVVDVIGNSLKMRTTISKLDKIRLGNIMARVRMIMLYDIARKHNALVCGTENKSEHHLGYFTRFGDEASDIEPIKHLYKTQVYQLATYLKIPDFVMKQEPTAGLWHGQTDEGEFGFSYKEADAVLYLHFDKNFSVKEIIKMGYKNADKILDWVKKNRYKHQVPYSL